MMRSISTYMAAAMLFVTTRGAAQEHTFDTRFSSVTTYIISVPMADTRDFMTDPSWLGLTWEATWLLRRNTVGGVLFGVNDFFHRTDGTVNFNWGAATGQQFRDLTVATLMGSGRWYVRGIAGRGPYLGGGAGLLWARQSYQLGVLPQLVRSAFHLAVAPEAGVAVPVWDGVEAIASVRYTLPSGNGRYLNGSSSRFQYIAIGFGLSEH